MPTEKTELSAEKQIKKHYLNLLFMLLAPAVMAWYYYGAQALLLLAVCTAGSALFDLVGVKFTLPRAKPPYDFSAFFTGAVIALMLPASFPLGRAAIGCAFAIIVAKMPFGSTHNAPFMPAAAGFAFLCVCWPAEVFNYPAIADKFALFRLSTAQGVAGSSLASMLQVGDSMRLSPINILHLLTGSIPGPMGSGAILVLLAAAFYFLFTRASALYNSFGFLFACGVVAFLFPRGANSSLSSLVLELCSGSLVFAALFLVNAETAESPQKPLPRLMFGMFTGLLCMLLRYFGVFEEGVCFAVLLANAVWPFAGIRLDKLRKSVIKPPANPLAEAELETGGGADAR